MDLGRGLPNLDTSKPYGPLNGMNQLPPHIGQLKLWGFTVGNSSTNSLNHLDTQVFNEDCNIFLSHAISHSLLEALDGKSHQLPCPGDVDIIFGGMFCVYQISPNPNFLIQDHLVKHLVGKQ